MAIISSTEQFIGFPPTLDTTERRSALINAESQPYTMQDFIDTINAGGGALVGTQYVFVQANGTDVANAAELQAAYITAQTMSPSATNRITIIAAPGNYNFGGFSFVMNIDYIDLVSLDGNSSIIFNSNLGGAIAVVAFDTFVKGVDVLTKNFFVGNSLLSIVIENCKGGDYSFGGFTTASGTFINCVGGDYSFGGSGGDASGTFIGCTGGQASFGGLTAFGSFTDCLSSDAGFASNGHAGGTFTNCVSRDTTFAYSFGGYGLATGTFRRCIGGVGSFAGDGGASGVFSNCEGSLDSFGGASGTLTGQLYYCRLTSPISTFQTVSGAGRTVLCIDGLNNQNNQ